MIDGWYVKWQAKHMVHIDTTKNTKTKSDHENKTMSGSFFTYISINFVEIVGLKFLGTNRTIKATFVK
jgi:hypothetical protein